MFSSMAPLSSLKLNFLSPDVEFCAYSIPHPSEPKMNIRIQTYGKLSSSCSMMSILLTLLFIDGTAVNALKKGLSDLQDVCDVVAEKFWSERQSFNAEQGIER